MAKSIKGSNIMSDIMNPSNWKKTRKKNYEVYVCRPAIGSKVRNKLEKADYVTDENKQFVISGTVGETWVIDINKLMKTYCFVDGTPITKEALSKRLNGGLIDWMHLKTLPGGGGNNWAIHLDPSIKNFPVKTSWGDTLYANAPGVPHGVGDFLVASDAGGVPNLNDVWVVNGEIFPTTYDMRAFPGLVQTSNTEVATPVPKSIIKDTRATNQANTNKSGTKRVMYQIVGRYMDGKEAVAYALQSIDKDKSGKYTREQVCYLVGRGQVTNCEAQLYNGKVLLRGKGINFDNLPSKQVNGELKNTDVVGKVRKDATAEQAMNQFLIVKTLKNGREVTGYVIKNAGNATRTVSRDEVIELAKQGRIGNARIQYNNGEVLLRGVGTNLSQLSSENLAVPKNVQVASAAVPSNPSNPSTRNDRLKTTSDNKIYITIDTLGVSDGTLNLHLISFNCKDANTLINYCNKLKNSGVHPFNNNGFNTGYSGLGNEYVAIIDDPVKNSLSFYKELAKRTKAEFMVARDLEIYDLDAGGELLDSMDSVAIHARDAMDTQCRRSGILRY